MIIWNISKKKIKNKYYLIDYLLLIMKQTTIGLHAEFYTKI
jgi:hypothetical protein